MADSPNPDPDDRFHCPQGDKPCPVTYQPGAWLAPPAEPTAAIQDRLHGSDELDASIQQASATCTRPWSVTPDDLAGLAADMKRVWVVGGELVGAGTIPRLLPAPRAPCNEVPVESS
jgi:hypothetical protein